MRAAALACIRRWSVVLAFTPADSREVTSLVVRSKLRVALASCCLVRSSLRLAAAAAAALDVRCGGIAADTTAAVAGSHTHCQSWQSCRRTSPPESRCMPDAAGCQTVAVAMQFLRVMVPSLSRLLSVLRPFRRVGLVVFYLRHCAARRRRTMCATWFMMVGNARQCQCQCQWQWQQAIDIIIVHCALAHVAP